MATLLELFTEDDFALIFEAVKQKATLEKYEGKVHRLARIQSIISSEAC